MTKVLRLLLLLVVPKIAFAASAAEAPSVIKGSDQFEFVYRVKLPEIKHEARLWIPRAKTDAFQQVELTASDIPVEWRDVHDSEYGNDICMVNATPADSGKTLEFHYRVTRKEKASYQGNGDDLARFLKAEALVPVNENFRTLATEATKGKTTDTERARALYDHVLARMRYDKSGKGWGRGDATYACDARTGNCTDFHAYYIALARSIGLPARFAIGTTIPADRDDGKIEGYHCWAEVYAGGQWVPVDISEAWKTPKLADYYFGHQPANRFELSKGRDLVVDPLPASGRINFLVYPLVERDGEVSPVETTFTFHRLRS